LPNLGASGSPFFAAGVLMRHFPTGPDLRACTRERSGPSSRSAPFRAIRSRALAPQDEHIQSRSGLFVAIGGLARDERRLLDPSDPKASSPAFGALIGWLK
jgi:hypothetical protein